MKSFLKENTVFCIVVILSLITFSTLFYFSFLKSSENEILTSKITDNQREADSVINSIEDLQFVKSDFEQAKSDMKFLAQRQKRTKQYFNSLVNVDNNLFVNPRSNTSTSVNAKITRLFSQLSNVCEQNNISVQSNSVSSNSFLSSESDSTEKEFGFGLSSYMGVWPSFSDVEATVVGVHAEIIKLVIENMASCTDKNSSIEILHVKRQPAGEIDGTKIGSDLLTLDGSNLQFLSSLEGLDSYLFEFKLKLKSKTLRNFLNSCKPPLIINSISVKPADDISLNSPIQGTTQFDLNPFASPATTNVQEQLPIVSVVDSEVTILFEYIISVDSGLHSIIDNFSGINSSPAFLDEFLTISGNQSLKK
jgi:hypothetical protein